MAEPNSTNTFNATTESKTSTVQFKAAQQNKPFYQLQNGSVYETKTGNHVGNTRTTGVLNKTL